MSSHLTAITRKMPSAPARYLQSQGLLRGTKLDYGCGKGKDAAEYGMDKYDPHYYPNGPELDQYDTIACTYVLNVIPKEDEREVIERIQSLLSPGGTGFITVRRDVESEGATSRGTYQRNVSLSLPVLKETSGYCIYILHGKEAEG